MELSVLNAGFAKDDDQWNYGPVSSSFFRLYLVTEGQAVVKTDSEHVLCPGHLYLIPAFTTHYDSSRGTFRHIYIHFYDHQHVLLCLLRNYRIPFSIQCTPLISQLFHHLMEVLPNLSLSNPVPDSYNSTSTILASINRFASLPIDVRMESTGIILQLLGCFFKKAEMMEPVRDERIASTLVFIEEHVSSKIKVSTLAENVGLSKEQFIRVFSRTMTESPVHYIMRRKIFVAQVLLSSGHHSIKEVSGLVGYDDTNYFSKVFKKIAGLSPRMFLAQNL